MTDLDLDKIEEEMTRINTLSVVERNDTYRNFIIESPKRIAALVKRVRESEEINNELIFHLKNIMIVGTKSSGTSVEASIADVALSQIFEETQKSSDKE